MRGGEDVRRVEEGKRLNHAKQRSAGRQIEMKEWDFSWGLTFWRGGCKELIYSGQMWGEDRDALWKEGHQRDWGEKSKVNPPRLQSCRSAAPKRNEWRTARKWGGGRKSLAGPGKKRSKTEDPDLPREKVEETANAC